MTTKFDDDKQVPLPKEIAVLKELYPNYKTNKPNLSDLHSDQQEDLDAYHELNNYIKGIESAMEGMKHKRQFFSDRIDARGTYIDLREVTNENLQD